MGLDGELSFGSCDSLVGRSGDVGPIGVADGDPVTRVQFDATGGWYEWDRADVDPSLATGTHTLGLVVFDGGWKLGQFELD